MMPNKTWIMSETDIEQFQNYKLQKYHASGIKGTINDNLLTQYCTFYIVQFFRKLKTSKQAPFKVQKIIYTAISLFKRFYLVNEFGDNFHAQNALCSIYLSLKTNQIPHQQIAKWAKAWKNKDKIFLNEECLHFKQQGYSDKQLYFLRGIGFQIGRSPITPAIQSLCNLIKNKIKDDIFMQQIIQQTKQMLRKVYTDPKAIFLFQGPKLGLAIVLHTVKVKQIEQKLNLKVQQIFDHSLDEILQNNKQQITKIVKYIQKLQKFDLKEKADQIKHLKDKLLVAKKKAFEVPQKKSPKISPLSFSFAELDE